MGTPGSRDQELCVFTALTVEGRILGPLMSGRASKFGGILKKC